MRGSRVFIASLLALSWCVTYAVTVAWDNAQPLPGQTITGTEILVDGSLVGSTDQATLTIDDSGWTPGDYAITARHVGTVDGSPASSDETPPLVYTVAGSGVPGVAPMMRFHQLDGAA